MNAPAFTSGGFAPPQNAAFQLVLGYGHPSSPFGQFATVQNAVAALPPQLNRVVWDVHNHYGVPFDIILGNLLGALAFICQGLSNVRSRQDEPMPLSAIVHVVGQSGSGKSTVYRRLMRSVEQTLKNWDHPWEFEDATPQGIKREAPLLALCGHEEGVAFLESALGRDFALQISLRDGFIPVVTRAKRQEGERRKKAMTRFTTVVNVQPGPYQDWLDRHREKAMTGGFLPRVWMVQSHWMVDRSVIGRYSMVEGGLAGWDARVSELLEQGIKNCEGGLENLGTMDIASDAVCMIDQAQSRYDQMAAQRPLAQAPALAIRHHEVVSVLAALFQHYEGGGPVITQAVVRGAVVVADYLAGQWLSIVFSPKPIPDEVQRGQRLLDYLFAWFRQTGVSSWRKSDVVVLAPNFNWSKAQMEAAITSICGTGLAQIATRIESGCHVVKLELILHATALYPASLPSSNPAGWPMLR